MNLQEFDHRMLHEEQMFLSLCLQEKIWDEVAGKISPTRAPAFAEGLILDLDISATKARILADPAGAAAVCEVVQALIRDRKNRKLLAADKPRENLTPFYVLSSLVLDVSPAELEEFERMLESDDPDSSPEIDQT